MSEAWSCIMVRNNDFFKLYLVHYICWLNLPHQLIITFFFCLFCFVLCFRLTKSISSTLFILSPHVESFSHVESHFCNFNSNTTLYFIFIFIKIIFSLFYFNFFSLSSFLFSLSSFLFCSLCSPKSHGNPYPRRTQARQTHGEPRHGKPTASPVTANPRPAQSRQTEAQIAAETKTQTHEQTETQTHKQTQAHRQPNHHQKINKGEGRASYGEQRERTEKRERAQRRERR
jgi:hypothetical protein